MIYTNEQLIKALYNEYVFLCHDDFDPNEDIDPDDYLEMIKTFSYDELISETGTDDTLTLQEFMETYG